MKRFLLAAVMVAAFGSSAFAQPGWPRPAPIPNPDPVPPPPTYSGPPGPAIPIHKSGNVVVGMQGYYPYDTGLYLLAETGLSRQSGWFTMVVPGADLAPPVMGAIPAGRGHFGKHGLFRH